MTFCTSQCPHERVQCKHKLFMRTCLYKDRMAEYSVILLICLESSLRCPFHVCILYKRYSVVSISHTALIWSIFYTQIRIRFGCRGCWIHSIYSSYFCEFFHINRIMKCSWSYFQSISRCNSNTKHRTLGRCKFDKISMLNWEYNN